ncbi:MAG: hypothetical protein IJK45_09125 [Bacteroidaceae bacterium]|nr:hypothetical protein [Bacteroidaceae bacterium]
MKDNKELVLNLTNMRQMKTDRPVTIPEPKEQREQIRTFPISAESGQRKTEGQRKYFQLRNEG